MRSWFSRATQGVEGGAHLGGDLEEGLDDLAGVVGAEGAVVEVPGETALADLAEIGAVVDLSSVGTTAVTVDVLGLDLNAVTGGPVFGDGSASGVVVGLCGEECIAGGAVESAAGGHGSDRDLLCVSVERFDDDSVDNDAWLGGVEAEVVGGVIANEDTVASIGLVELSVVVVGEADDARVPGFG